MVDTDSFRMEVECRVYEMERDVNAGEWSSVMPGSFAGWVSLSSRDLELTDKQVFDLLDSAHAQESFVREFMMTHDNATGCLRTIGVHGRVAFDDVWVNCTVAEEYLETVIGEMDDGDTVLNSLEEYDTPVEII